MALLLLSSGVGAQDVATVRVVGLSSSQGQSLVAQRESAIQDALRNAVQQVVGVHLSTSTLVENYELVEDRVYSRAAGVALLSRIVEEGPTSEGTYRVLAEVAVNEADVVQELHALIRANGDPRVLVVALGGNSAARSLTIAVLEDDLLRSGFSVVVGMRDLPTGPDGSEALRVGADLLATVDIDEHENSNTSAVLRGANLVSVTATLTARLIAPASGRVIDVQLASSTKAGTDRGTAAREAVQSAAAVLGKELAEAAGAWLQGTSDAQRVSVLILEGSFGFDDVQGLTTELELRYGATTTLRTFSTGNAVLEVDFIGRAQGLLSVLTELGWDVVALEGDRITARRD